MSNWQPVKYQIIKQSDRKIFNAFKQIIGESGLEFKQAAFNVEVAGNITLTDENLYSHDELNQILDYGASLVSSFTYDFGDIRVSVSRQSRETTTDEVTFARLNNNSPVEATKAMPLLGLVKQYLSSFESDKFVGAVLGKELQQFYDTRDIYITKQEEIVANTVTKLGEQIAEVRLNLEKEYQERTKHLNEEFKTQQEQLQENQRKRAAELDQREEELATRLQDINDRENRHERRQIRKDLKGEIAARNVEFQLTPGTRKLRSPVWIIAGITLLITGSSLVASMWLSFQQIAIGTQLAMWQNIEFIVLRLIVAVSFGSIIYFLIKWSNRWFEQHAQEEFLLKRFDLDLDRASWVVEMALEWKEEKGTDIPEELIDRLTQNLFSHNNDLSEEPLHPADQLASALLGASAEATVELPGGRGAVKFDRRGIKQLSKMNSKDKNTS